MCGCVCVISKSVLCLYVACVLAYYVYKGVCTDKHVCTCVYTCVPVYAHVYLCMRMCTIVTWLESSLCLYTFKT